MEGDITKYIDIETFARMMENFYKLTGISYLLKDLKGNILSSAGWTDICTKFHRKNEASLKKCRENDTRVINSINDYEIYKCKNGLMEVRILIYLKDCHVANLMFGQFLFEKPNIDFFINQAELYGFNKEEYMKAVKKIPIISKEKLDSSIKFFQSLGKLLSNMIDNNYKAMYTEELEKANDKLKEQEKRYRSLLEILPYGICVRKGEKIVYGNSTAANIFSLKNSDEFINLNMNDLFKPHPDVEREFKRKLKQIDLNGNSDLEEEVLINKITGEIINLETLGANIKFDGEDATLVVFRDIKNVKKLEKRNKKLKESLNYERLRTDCFSNMSHELRTPINIIYSANKMYSIVMNDKEKMKKYSRIIEQNCYRLTKLVNDILDINKMDFGSMQLEKAKYNLVEVIENTVGLMVDYAKNKGINVIFDTEKEEILTICDGYKIERVMFNLLSNAVKFTEKNGEIFVKIFLKDKMINISVKDTGRGISKDKIDSIFNKFVQAGKSLIKNNEGTGLGLYIVKSIIEMHGGNIFVKSTVGKGSEFIFNLPIIESNEEVLSFSPNAEKCSIEFSGI